MTDKSIARFFEQVEAQPTGCWLWTGCSARGYGRFHYDGHEEKAHRFSYRYFFGDLPPYTPSNGELDHLCRNRACVNPTHLDLVAHVTNIRRGKTGYAPHSVETRAKLKAARARNPRSPMQGLKHSLETRQKQSVARRAFWQRKREAA